MIIIHMAWIVDNINVPMARASILWLIGEYSPILLDIINIALLSPSDFHTQGHHYSYG